MIPRFDTLDRLSGVSRRRLTVYILVTGVLTVVCLAAAIIETTLPEESEQKVHTLQIWLWGIDTLLITIGGILLLASRRAVSDQAWRNEILQASEQEFRALVGSSPVLTRVVQADGACTFVNAPWLTFTGMTAEASAGAGWIQSVFEEDRERCRRTLGEHLRDRTPFSMEYRVRRNDGAFRWILDRGMPRFDASGTFIGAISSCIDVNEQHEQEARVRELNEALENAVEGISTLSNDLRFVSMNSAYATALGADPEEVIDQPLAQTIHPADRHEVDGMLAKLDQFGKAGGEFRGVRLDGTIFYMRLALVARYSEHHERLGIHCFMKDITAELKSRDLLAARERELIDYFQNAMIGVRVLDTSGVIVDVNRAELTLLGYPRNEYVGRRVQDFHVNPIPIEDMLARVARGETISDFEADLRCRDGSTKTVVISWSGQFEHGKLRGVRSFTQDITERRLAESVAHEHSLRFESLGSIAPVGIFHTDAEGNCMYVNDRWCKLAGMTLLSALGKGWAQALHPDDRERVFASWSKAVETGTEFRDEYRFVTKDRRIAHLLGAASPLRDQNGNLTGYIGTATDITETKQSRDDLLKALQAQLELLQRERSLRQELDHRVRNNLASLMGLVSVYERTDRSTEELARTIRGKISAMVQVHETIARAQGREVEIGSLLETLRHSFIPEGSPTRFVLEGQRAMLSSAEASALAMIVQELVTNSIKYGAIASGHGEITLSWTVSERLAGGDPVSILDLVWNEKGRAERATIPPLGSGVGLSLIEGFARTDLRGSAEFERGVDDWRCHIVAELSSPPSGPRLIANAPASVPLHQELNR